ncbi:MAG: hypothetical protein LBR29_04030 [Methylobacteriaceae bacterium]|jgi:biotin carboxyl carrier protein|nr:hypothetical protein [Methylobacteriaceae bacterium]
MARNLKIVIDGRSYTVSVEDLDHPDGFGVSAPVAAPVAAAPVAAAAPAAAPAAAASAPKAEKKAAVAAGANDVVAPMTGVLLEYVVAEGDSVTEGQQVATLEAMKMKTAITAVASGKVTKLHVTPGSPVDVGEVLLSIG